MHYDIIQIIYFITLLTHFFLLFEYNFSLASYLTCRLKFPKPVSFILFVKNVCMFSLDFKTVGAILMKLTMVFQFNPRKKGFKQVRCLLNQRHYLVFQCCHKTFAFIYILSICVIYCILKLKSVSRIL